MIPRAWVEVGRGEKNRGRGHKGSVALVLAQVLGWRMGPANLRPPWERQVWGREDKFLVVAVISAVRRGWGEMR